MIAGLLATLAFAFVPVQTVDEIAEALRSDPVYVDPGAERALTDDEEQGLEEQIQSSGERIFIAVLPSSMGSGDELLTDLESTTGLAGTYAVIAGDEFRSTDVDAANAAFQEARGDGPAAVLEQFVDEVGGEGGGGSTGGSGDGSDGGSSWVPLALIGAGGVGLYALYRRRRRQQDAEEDAELEADRQMLRAELSVLSSDVLRLEPEVVTRPEARGDYEAAVDRFRAASAALDYADEPVDLVRVERVVQEARYAMARARAIVAGHEPPPPPDELRRPGRHNEPPLDLDEQGQPMYVGGGPFYGGGWFGGGGGLFSGLLLGSMLGGFGGFGGWGGGWGGGYGDDGGGGGGDWGGGDFGGGDFGGGDFGGGDF